MSRVGKDWCERESRFIFIIVIYMPRVPSFHHDEPRLTSKSSRGLHKLHRLGQMFPYWFVPSLYWNPKHGNVVSRECSLYPRERKCFGRYRAPPSPSFCLTPSLLSRDPCDPRRARLFFCPSAISSAKAECLRESLVFDSAYF